MCASFPYYGYSDDDLILYFYNGLLNDEVRMVNAASRGFFLSKTPTAAREFLEELVEGSRQFSKRKNLRKTSLEGSSSNTKVHKLEDKVEALTSMMRDFMVKNKTQQIKACGICSLDHATDTCPKLQEETYEEAKTIGFLGQNQNFSRRNDPYAPKSKSQPTISRTKPSTISTTIPPKTTAATATTT